MSKSLAPNTLHILVADDSVVCRSVLVILLENAGYKVTSALDGVEALAALRKEKFNLAILDNEMPNLDGITALAELRTFLPDLPVVICSGTVTPEQAIRYTQLNISDRLDKPVDPRRLRDKVGVIIEQHRLRTLEQPAHRPAHSQTSPGFLVSDKDQALSRPPFVGTSKTTLKFRGDFIRVREFRAAAIFEGPAGSGLLELAFGASLEAQTFVVASPAAAINSSVLLERLADSRDEKQSILIVVTESERLTSEQQDLLASLIAAKPSGEFAPYAGRVRLVLCAESSLSDLADAGEFNEMLLMRAGAMILRVPSLAERKEDLGAISRAIVRRLGAGVAGMTDDAAAWVGKQPWPGDYLQLHRTIELAVRLAAGKTLAVDHLASAASQEPAFKEPLFHELLPEKVAVSRRKAATGKS